MSTRHTGRRLAAATATTAVVLGVTALGAVPATAHGGHGGHGGHGDKDDYEILVVGETLGFRHSHIDEVTEALIGLGQDNGFTVDVWDPPNSSAGWWGSGSPGQPDLTLPSTPFTSTENLSQYSSIVFVSPVDNTNSLNPATPRLLDDAELAALQGYVHDGGGVVGLHAATDTMHTSPWYTDLVGGGARFSGHPQQQTATMRVESPAHPSMEGVPLVWERWDEWYNYTLNPRENVHVLMTLDESTYTGGTMGEDHPIAWCQNFEGGRSWYQGAGHVEESWTDPTFLTSVLRGVEWTAGKVSGGGNCVTWSEVDGLVDDLGDGHGRDRAAAKVIGKQLDKAEQLADADKPWKAVLVLRTSAVLADALVRGDAGDVLHDKIDDLADWQKGLAQAGL
ncbi:ThuA domain-containing protein [Isoptericola dokdonensis]|jgi:type 1 glutamine amidotransferase|uniref:Trehalose utilization n=1 Tax=Isoptericola dokdonensis DS-3 TaxID=1300344 RepID=A0A161I856_9MICO|nr:ThuA domain-containing protein [Isoptericola dokdonensis]ANC31908.1 Trehalose utilization [Isoptericola dokdonensis DS-3]